MNVSSSSRAPATPAWAGRGESLSFGAQTGDGKVQVLGLGTSFLVLGIGCLKLGTSTRGDSIDLSGPETAWPVRRLTVIYRW